MVIVLDATMQLWLASHYTIRERAHVAVEEIVAIHGNKASGDTSNYRVHLDIFYFFSLMSFL